jgi:hypothetical protein
MGALSRSPIRSKLGGPKNSDALGTQHTASISPGVRRAAAEHPHEYKVLAHLTVALLTLCSRQVHKDRLFVFTSTSYRFFKHSTLMPDTLATVAISAITLFGLLHLCLRWVHDDKEPPIAPTSIPFIGHLIGLTKKKSRYYVELRLVEH